MLFFRFLGARLVATFLAVFGLWGMASAAPVSLGSITHDYGSGVGQVASASLMGGGANCDTLNASSITVRAGSSCGQRFYDQFDFSGLGFDTIDRYEVTLDFSGTRNQYAGTERWYLRPASSTSVGSSDWMNYELNASGVQTFVLNSALDIFPAIAGGNLFLWFSSTAPTFFGLPEFTLNSARVEIFGTPAATPIPIPGTLALALAPLGFIAGTTGLRRAREQHRDRRRDGLGRYANSAGSELSS